MGNRHLSAPSSRPFYDDLQEERYYEDQYSDGYGNVYRQQGEVFE